MVVAEEEETESSRVEKEFDYDDADCSFCSGRGLEVGVWATPLNGHHDLPDRKVRRTLFIPSNIIDYQMRDKRNEIRKPWAV